MRLLRLILVSFLPFYSGFFTKFYSNFNSNVNLKTALTRSLLFMAKSNKKSKGSSSSSSGKGSTSVGASSIKKIFPPRPEFSRLVNANQVPQRRSVLCRIVAKEKECQGLAIRYDIYNITYFGANVTLIRQDGNSIQVSGTFEAHMKVAELVEPEILREDFETLLLDNSGAMPGTESLSFEDNMDYDDEIGSDGAIDIGEIAAQYFSLEM